MIVWTYGSNYCMVNLFIFSFTRLNNLFDNWLNNLFDNWLNNLLYNWLSYWLIHRVISNRRFVINVINWLVMYDR